MTVEMHMERPSFNCFPQIIIITESAAFEESAEIESDDNDTNAFASIIAINSQMSSPGAEGGPAASGRRPARQRGAGVAGCGLREPRPRNPSCAAIWGGGGRRRTWSGRRNAGPVKSYLGKLLQ